MLISVCYGSGILNKSLTGSALKIVAGAAMLIDHIAVVMNRCMMLPAFAYYIMRGIGRLSFPVFAFLVAEGFAHTRSVKKYVIRMILFAVISEVPFDMVNFGKIFCPARNNILFTYILSLGALWAFSKVCENTAEKLIVAALSAIAAVALSVILKTDYSYRGVLLVLIFYYFRSDKPAKYILASLVLLMGGSLLSLAAPAALLIIGFYDGTRGSLSGYAMYVFYPAHMFLIGLAGMLLS